MTQHMKPFNVPHQQNADEYYSIPIAEGNHAKFLEKPPNSPELKSIISIKTKPPKNEAKSQPVLTGKLSKNSSFASLKMKQQKRHRPHEYAKSGEATFAEITRLISVNDIQKSQINKLIDQVKTLKIINARQEKGLERMDKEQGDYPKLFKAMSEELRVSKADRQRAVERIAYLERVSVTQSEEHHKLQTRYKDLKAKMKKMQTSDVELLRQENIQFEVEIAKKTLQVEELTDKLKIMTAERDREVGFAKTKTSKLTKDVEIAKAEIERLQSILQERERVVNSLSIYSRNTMHESDGESSNHSSQKSYKKVKKRVIQSMSKQLSRISDTDEESLQQLPKTPILTLSLNTNQEFNISNKEKIALEPEEQTVYKPALKNLTKITSPIADYIHQSYTPKKASSSKFTSPIDGKPNSRFTSPIPHLSDNHLHTIEKTHSVYSDDFE